jgi:hypothetical protein
MSYLPQRTGQLFQCLLPRQKSSVLKVKERLAETIPARAAAVRSLRNVAEDNIWHVYTTIFVVFSFDYQPLSQKQKKIRGILSILALVLSQKEILSVYLVSNLA